MVMLVMMTGLMVLAPASAQDACTATLSSHRFAFNDPFPLVDDGDSPARSWYIKTPSMLRRCFNEFPLNPQEGVKTLDALLAYLQFYVFLDHNRGAPYNLTINLDMNLRYLKGQVFNFTNEYDFHVAVRETLRQSRDGHLHYNLPKGYSGHYIIQPLAMIADMSEGIMRFYVKDDVSQGLHNRFFGKQIPLSDYRGWEVVAIDGQAPLDVIRGLARDYPIGKDPGVNFNFALFHLFSFRTSILPDYDTVRFLLVRGNETKLVQVNYLVLDSNLGMRPIASKNQPGIASCSQQRRENALSWISTAPETPMSRTLHHREWFEHFARNSTRIERRSTFGSNFRMIRQLPGSDSGLFVFKEKTLILRLTSFMPPSNNFDGWQQLLQYIVRNGHQYERLVIDIRDNVGGIVCLGSQLAALIRGVSIFEAQTIHDVRKSALFDQYIPQMPVFGAGATSSQAQQYLLDQIYRMPERVYSRGGAPRRYSAPFMLDCRDFARSFSAGTQFPFNPSTNVTILSNGIAISTASSFVKAVKGYVPIFSFGGDPGLPISSSFSIGNPVVVNTASLYGMLACSNGLMGLNRFPKLPTSADIGFSFAEAYENQDLTAVAEFQLDAPDFYLPLWDNNDAGKIYDAILSKH